MTDFNKLFSNLRTMILNINEDNYTSLKSIVNNYFSQIGVDYNFKSKNKDDYLSWIDSMGDKNRKMHIYYYNKLDNIKNLSKYYLNLKNHELANNTMKEFVNGKVNEIKKENSINENKMNVNKRLSKYYNEGIENTNYYTKIIKYIFYTLLIISFVTFLVKKQYTNLKILFYLILLFVFPYIIQPIWNILLEYSYKTNRIYHLYFSYFSLFLTFSLFVSFKYFVFSEGDISDGRRDLYILGFIIAFGAGSLLVNWLFYSLGIKPMGA
tara:strand:+ start:953 stop:1753 length:801 start_codon:yes stop_codon:yes gene_type:complete